MQFRMDTVRANGRGLTTEVRRRNQSNKSNYISYRCVSYEFTLTVI